MKIAAFCLALFCLAPISLFADQEAALGEEQEKEFVLPLLLNLLPGFGLGSFIQGDHTGGVILLIADLAGYGTMGAGFLMVMGSIFYGLLTLHFEYFWGEWGVPEWLLVIGGSIVIISKVFGIIRPIWFGVEYNNELRKRRIMVEVLPAVAQDSECGTVHFGVDLRLTFPFD